jgi:hypothetical protein
MKHAHNFKDITGKRYGYLVAICPHGFAATYSQKQGRDIKRAVWLFRCDCGKEITKCRATLEQYIRTGLTISCGCKSFIEKLGNKHGLWKGYGEIPLAYFSRLKRQSKRGGHRKRDIEFTLDIKYLWELFLKQNRKCALSGYPLCFGTTAEVKNKENREPIASLDRINSTKGYIEGNVQWIHKNLNYMKQNLSDEKFIEWCKKVAYYSVDH